MPGRQHESIPSKPRRVVRVIAHDRWQRVCRLPRVGVGSWSPQCDGDTGGTHHRSRMTALELLTQVGGQCTDRVEHERLCLARGVDVGNETRRVAGLLGGGVVERLDDAAIAVAMMAGRGGGSVG